MRVLRFAAIVPLLLFIADARAQRPIELAPVVSFEYGSPLFINHADNVFNLSAGSGSAPATSYGLGAQVDLAHLLNEQWGAHARVLGVFTTGHFASDDGSITISGNDTKLQLEASLEWNPAALLARVGGWYSARVGGSVTPDVPNNRSPSNHSGALAAFGWRGGWIDPEINTHVDLMPGVLQFQNRFSFGVAVAIPLQAAASPELSPPPSAATPVAGDRLNSGEALAAAPPVAGAAIAPGRVRFLVNRSELEHDVQLQHVELRVKEYTMIDSPNVAPRVAQWVTESYHLPHLGIAVELDRDARGWLRLYDAADPMMDISLVQVGGGHGAVTSDTSIVLDNDPHWQKAIANLNIHQTNAIVAELTQSTPAIQRITSLDTLILPPVDSSEGHTIVKKEFRFILSDRYNEFAQGREALDLLLDRIHELADSSVRVTIAEPRIKSPSYRILKARVLNAIAGRAKKIDEHESSDATSKLIVVVEL